MYDCFRLFMAIAVVLVVMITLTITVHVYGYWHCMRYQTSGNLLPSCWTVAGAVLTQSVPLPGMPLFRTKGLRVREATQLVGLQALWESYGTRAWSHAKQQWYKPERSMREATQAPPKSLAARQRAQTLKAPCIRFPGSRFPCNITFLESTQLPHLHSLFGTLSRTLKPYS